MKNLRYLTIILLIFPIHSFSQSPAIHDMNWRNIGPANQGGRIVDIDANENDFTKVYVASASGGVWKSVNAGTTWEPIFDNYETASIGDIALDQQNPNTLWVGTGEANNRNSVSWGNGIYKSTDAGESFQNMGLENTHTIARISINSQDSEELCVCSTGHLWGYSGERGIFQTKNGGKSWKKLKGGLPNDGKTGCTDLVRDPKDPNILYAAMYHRLRQPWHFHSGGEQGGIYKSTNGGRSWRKLSQGLPQGPTGRIGLAIYRSNPKILMALVEAEKTDDLSKPGSGLYRSEDGGESWTYMNTYNNRPFYYSQVRINPLNDQRVYLLTTRFMVSDDGGKTLRNGSEDQEVHGDFHALWSDPNNVDRYYLGADKGLSITHDHGDKFLLFDNFAIGQFYRINYDMRDPYYVYGGFQDNGMYGTASFSRDARGILNDSNWKLHWGDGQYVAVNPFDWRDMYTSMENGSYFSYDPLTHRIRRISPTPATILNYASFFPDTITDKASASRFNWEAPLIMSPHDPNHLYVAGNHVYRSIDKGKSWTIISPDLSTNDRVKRKQGISGGITPDNTGAETHCAISSVSISPIGEHILWVATDDGNVHITQDGGQTWKNVRANIPKVGSGIWASRIEASHFDPNSAYVSFDGHRSDDFGTYLFKTQDGGTTWQEITHGISEGEVIRVVREDLVNANLLFAGTETGIWMSLDQGENWERYMSGFPTVSVYDLKIHPRDHDLIAGTHGRSIWIMDDIRPLQQFTQAVKNAPIHLFEQGRATIWENVSRGGQRGHFWYGGENPASIENTNSKARAGFRSLAPISYYVGEGVQGNVQLVISDISGKNKRVIDLENTPGIHRYYWDLEFDAEPYTSEERAFVEETFEYIIEQYGFSSLRRMYAAFQNAKTPKAARKALEPLTQGYLSLDIDASYGMPKAAAGTYRLTLKAGATEMSRSLEIRDDPLLKED